MNILSSLPSWLMEATLRGSAGIILIWLLAPLARRWIGAQAAHLLWLMALVPLLIPVLPASPLTFASAPAVQPEVAESRFAGAQIFVSVDDGPAERTAAVPVRTQPRSTTWRSLVLPVWALGAALVGVLALVQGIRAKLLVRRAPEITHEPLVISVLAHLPKMPQRVLIRETGELRSPAVCGVWKPTILLPLGWWKQLTPAEFECVLLHELGHIRRGDLLWRWAFLIARAVHWFNPLVWLAERSARVDQELACDEWVLSQSGAPDVESYGEVLLKASALLKTARFSSPVHATMAESKLGLIRRIQHLGRARRHGWAAAAAALSLSALATVFIAPPASHAQEAVAPAGAQVAPTPVVPSPRKVQGSAATPPPAEGTLPPAGPLIEIEAKFVEISEAEIAAVTSEAAAPETPATTSPPPTHGRISQAAIDALLFGSGSSRTAESLTGVFTDPQFQVIQRALNQKKGLDILSAPRVTAKAGQRAVIEIIREFRYPTEFAQQDTPGYVWPKAFETRNTGVTLEVLPTVAEDGTIELDLSPQVVEFLGFVNYRAPRPARPAESKDAMNDLLERVVTAKVVNQPVFRTRKITTTLNLRSGETALVGGMGLSKEELAASKGFLYAGSHDLSERVNSPDYQGEQKKVVPRSLYIFITAKQADAKEEPGKPGAAPSTPAPAKPEMNKPAPSAPAAPPDPKVGVPVGTPVAGKPGFVFSPHAPNAGFVDVRGFPAGAEIQCPFSGLHFLVP
ncbi:MAG: M56 family metallopeptidase [Chthoniobacteraceae bacterium]